MQPLRRRIPYITVLAAVAASCLLATGQVVQVDTELLLIVEVSKDVDDASFSTMIQAYGNAMTSASVIAAIQSGSTKKIAASVLFWSGDSQQTMGLNWMEISDLTSAQNFSSQLATLTSPFKGKKTAIASAIDASVPLFGTETGGSENGFSSLTQIIDVAGYKIDDDSKPKNTNGDVLVANANAAARAAGIDMISGVVINDTSGAVANYYNSFVIGGSVGNTPASVSSAIDLASLENTLTSVISQNVQNGALVSVPEPSGFLILAASPFLFYRRRQQS